MRYVIYGAGAIGGVMGARLHQAGREVLLIARGAHLDAIRDHGLTLASPDGRDALPIPVAAHPGEVDFRQDDIMLLAMKTQDTAAALDALAAAGVDDLPIVCAQNGVENERLALRQFPRVYGMMVILPGSHLEAGVVEVSTAPLAGALVVGRYPAGLDEVAEAIAKDFDASGFTIRAADAVMRWKYAKLLSNLGNIGDAAFKGQDTGPLRHAMVQESLACYRAAGIDYVPEEERLELHRALFSQERSLERPGGSTWQSVARGLPSLETAYLNGEISLLGRLHDVPTPANDRMLQISRDITRTHAPPGSLDASAVMRELGLEA